MGGKKGFTLEQIIWKLTDAEVLLSKGSSVEEMGMNSESLREELEKAAADLLCISCGE
jgi:hypothetical protein